MIIFSCDSYNNSGFKFEDLERLILQEQKICIINRYQIYVIHFEVEATYKIIIVIINIKLYKISILNRSVTLEIAIENYFYKYLQILYDKLNLICYKTFTAWRLWIHWQMIELASITLWWGNLNTYLNHTWRYQYTIFTIAYTECMFLWIFLL